MATADGIDDAFARLVLGASPPAADGAADGSADESGAGARMPHGAPGASALHLHLRGEEDMIRLSSGNDDDVILLHGGAPLGPPPLGGSSPIVGRSAPGSPIRSPARLAEERPPPADATSTMSLARSLVQSLSGWNGSAPSSGGSVAPAGAATSVEQSAAEQARKLLPLISYPATWRSGQGGPAMLAYTLLQLERPQLTSAMIEHWLQGDDRLDALTAALVRPLDKPLHAGAGSMGQDALAALAAGSGGGALDPSLFGVLPCATGVEGEGSHVALTDAAGGAGSSPSPPSSCPGAYSVAISRLRGAGGGSPAGALLESGLALARGEGGSLTPATELSLPLGIGAAQAAAFAAAVTDLQTLPDAFWTSGERGGEGGRSRGISLLHPRLEEEVSALEGLAGIMDEEEATAAFRGVELPEGRPTAEALRAAAGAERAAVARSYRAVRLLTGGTSLADELFSSRCEELTRAALSVFSSRSKGSPAHACVLLQRLLQSQPNTVVHTLASNSQRYLGSMLPYLHHAGVADCLVQLVTVAHLASSAGGAGPNADMSGGFRSVSPFGDGGGFGGLALGGSLAGAAGRERLVTTFEGSLPTYCSRGVAPAFSSRSVLWRSLSGWGFLHVLASHVSSPEYGPVPGHVEAAADAFMQIVRAAACDAQGDVLLRPLGEGGPGGLVAALMTGATVPLPGVDHAPGAYMGGDGTAPARQTACMRVLSEVTALSFTERLPAGGEPGGPPTLGLVPGPAPPRTVDNRLAPFSPAICGAVVAGLPHLGAALVRCHVALHPKGPAPLWAAGGKGRGKSKRRSKGGKGKGGGKEEGGEHHHGSEGEEEGEGGDGGTATAPASPIAGAAQASPPPASPRPVPPPLGVFPPPPPSAPGVHVHPAHTYAAPYGSFRLAALTLLAAVAGRRECMIRRPAALPPPPVPAPTIVPASGGSSVTGSCTDAVGAGGEEGGRGRGASVVSLAEAGQSGGAPHSPTGSVGGHGDEGEGEEGEEEAGAGAGGKGGKGGKGKGKRRSKGGKGKGGKGKGGGGRERAASNASMDSTGGGEGGGGGGGGGGRGGKAGRGGRGGRGNALSLSLLEDEEEEVAHVLAAAPVEASVSVAEAALDALSRPALLVSPAAHAAAASACGSEAPGQLLPTTFNPAELWSVLVTSLPLYPHSNLMHVHLAALVLAVLFARSEATLAHVLRSGRLLSLYISHYEAMSPAGGDVGAGAGADRPPPASSPPPPASPAEGEALILRADMPLAPPRSAPRTPTAARPAGGARRARAGNGSSARGVILRILNAVRLAASAEAPSSFLPSHLRDHARWAEFLPRLKEDTLAQGRPLVAAPRRGVPGGAGASPGGTPLGALGSSTSALLRSMLNPSAYSSLMAQGGSLLRTLQGKPAAAGGGGAAAEVDPDALWALGSPLAKELGFGGVARHGAPAAGAGAAGGGVWAAGGGAGGVTRPAAPPPPRRYPTPEGGGQAHEAAPPPPPPLSLRRPGQVAKPVVAPRGFALDDVD